MYRSISLILLQACKGKEEPKYSKIETDTSVGYENYYILPEEADFLIGYCTQEGILLFNFCDRLM